MIDDWLNSSGYDRLDDIVRRRYWEAGEGLRNVWQKMRTSWRDDESLAKRRLSTMHGMSGVSVEDDEAAMRSILDYWFEPYVMSTMSLGQARDYYLGVENLLSVKFENSLRTRGRPVVLETLHHSMTFSALYLVVQKLVREQDIKRVVLLHLREKIEPRLELCRVLVERNLGVEPVGVRLSDDWLRKLKGVLSGDTLLIYMGDMSPSVFPTRRRKEVGLATIRLNNGSIGGLEIECVSVAATLARRYGADHWALDFPGGGAMRIRAGGQADQLCCPLTEWVFWPSLDHLYRIPRDNRGIVR